MLGSLVRMSKGNELLLCSIVDGMGLSCGMVPPLKKADLGSDHCCPLCPCFQMLLAASGHEI